MKPALYLLHLLLAGIPFAHAGTRKGEKLLEQGRLAERREEYDRALVYYEQAYATDPSDAAYALGLHRVRFQAGQAHVIAGQKLATVGEWTRAIAEFRKALVIDPGSPIAQQELSRAVQLSAGVKDGQPVRTAAEKEKSESERKIDSALPAPELKPMQSVLSQTKLVNQPPKVLFETVGKMAGVNVLFDTNYQGNGKTYTVEFANHTLEQALDYLCILTKTFWKPISSNAIFVAQESPANRHEYEEQEVKVFYLRNIFRPEEINEVVAVLRTLMEMRHISVSLAQAAILVRGTADQILLAEKLIRDMDKPRSEVVVDLLVLETSRGTTREITAALSGSSGYGITFPVAFTPRNPTLYQGSSSDTSKTTGIALSQVGRISTGDFSTALPNAVLNLIASDRQSRMRQSPQIRTIDGQKASVKIGQRIPFASGSLNTGLAGSGGNPLISTQFQFADVGVNVDITPRVHSADEVTLHIEMDISDQGSPVEIGGVKEPVIGQRKITHDIRVRNGEASILAGLAQQQDSRNQSGIPGLTHIPLLRSLLGSNSSDKQQVDLLVAIIPHIIRSPEYTAANLRAISVGTEQVVKMTLAPRDVESAPTVRFGATPTTVVLGESFLVALETIGTREELRFRAQFDPKLLRLEEIVSDKADGAPVITQDIRNEQGTASVTLRFPSAAQTGGVSLRFQTRGKGIARIRLNDDQTAIVAIQ